MRKNLYIGLAALAALTLSSCQREANFNAGPDMVTVTLTADKAGDATRAAAVEGESKVTYEWTDADIANLKLFVVGQSEGENPTETLTPVEDVTTSVSSDNRVLSITATVEANSTLRAVVASKLTGKDGELTRKPRLITSQNPAVDNFDPNADILIAEDVTVSGLDQAKLNFQRPVTVNKMTLKGLTAGETVSKVVITSKDNLAGYYKYDTQAFTGDGKELTLHYENVAVGSDGEFPVYFVAMPNEGHTLSITVETVKSSKDWRYTKTLDGTVNFTVGKFSKFGVNLAGCGKEIEEVDYTGDRVIIGMDGTAAYAMLAYAGGNNTPALGVQLDTDKEKIVTTKVNEIKMHFEKATDAAYAGMYTIADANGKYFYAASGSANQMKADNPAEFTADYYWKVTEEADGTHSIVAEKSTKRNIMRFNSGNTIFSCYASGQQPVKLYPYSWVEEEHAQTSGDGTLESPFNVAAALAYTGALDADVNSTEDIYIAGKICKVTGTYSASGTYGNATFFISDDGATSSPQFQAYRLLYLGNQKWTTGQTDIKVGDAVILCGKVVNYHGSTPETVANEAYLYSLNGDTGSGTGTYSIIIASDIQNGTVTASMTSNIEDGESITITVTPAAGYELETLTVDGADVTSEVVDNQYNFDMPDHDVAVSATFKSAGPVTYAFTTIAELNALVTTTSASYSGKLTNAVVSFVPQGNTAIIKDATGSIMYYKKDHGLAQGQTFSGDITVTAVMYSSNNNPLYPEITDIGSASFSGDGAVVAPETVTLADLNGNYDQYQNAYVKVENLTVTGVSGKNINVTDGTNNYVVYLQYGNATCGAGDFVTAVGTVTKYNTTEEVKVWKEADLTVSSSTPKTVTFTQPTQAGCSIAVSVDGSAIESGATVAAGKVVTLTATVGTGFTFDSWNVVGATVANATATTTTFTMGSSPVTVSASFGSNDNKNVWEDDFSSCKSGSGALTSLTGSTSGFSGSYSGLSAVYPMDGAIRVGKASAAGSITTPVLSKISGSSVDLTVTFKAAGWNGKTAKLTITASKGTVTEGQTVIDSEETMSGNSPSMTGTTYTFHVTGADNTTTLTFSTTNSIGIDDLVITPGD